MDLALCKGYLSKCGIIIFTRSFNFVTSKYAIFLVDITPKWPIP
jgi:hypothetical protein